MAKASKDRVSLETQRENLVAAFRQEAEALEGLATALELRNNAAIESTFAAACAAKAVTKATLEARWAATADLARQLGIRA